MQQLPPPPPQSQESSISAIEKQLADAKLGGSPNLNASRLRSTSSPPPPPPSSAPTIEGKKTPSLPRLDMQNKSSTDILPIPSLQIEGSAGSRVSGVEIDDFGSLKERQNSFYESSPQRTSSPSQGGPLLSQVNQSNRSSRVSMTSNLTFQLTAPLSPGISQISPTSPIGGSRPTVFSTQTSSAPSPGAITLADFKFRDTHPRRQRQLFFILNANETARKNREGSGSRSRKDSASKRDKGSSKNALSKLNALLKHAKKTKKTRAGLFHLLTLSIHDQRANLACTLIEDLSPNTIKKKRPSEANKCLLMSMANGMENVACALIDKGFPLNVNAGVFGSVPPNQQPQKSSRFSSTTQKDFNPIPPPSAVLSQVSFPSYFMLSVGIGLENFTKIMAKRANVNQGWYGLTPLHVACCKGSIPIVNSLLENGAEVMAGLPLDDFLVLAKLKSDAAKASSKEFAFSKHQWKSLEEKRGLREQASQETKKKSKLNSNNIPEEYKRAKKIAPVELAAATGRLELMRFLLSRYDQKTISQLSFCFLMQKSLEMTCHFIRAGANPDSQRDPWGSSCLHIAARNGWLDLVITYLFNKMNVNQKGENSWTPLHEAVSQKQKAVAQYLMRNGANADALSDQNETPKQLGRRSGISDAELTQYFDSTQLASQEEIAIVDTVKKYLVTDSRTHTSDPKLSSLIYKRKPKIVGMMSSTDSTDSLPDKFTASDSSSTPTPPAKQLTKSGSDVFFKSMFGRKKDKSNTPSQE